MGSFAKYLAAAILISSSLSFGGTGTQVRCVDPKFQGIWIFDVGTQEVLESVSQERGSWLKFATISHSLESAGTPVYTAKFVPQYAQKRFVATQVEPDTFYKVTISLSSPEPQAALEYFDTTESETGELLFRATCEQGNFL